MKINNLDSLQRYHKQVIFKNIGIEGQHKLLNSSVVVAGCGGLGTVITNSLVRLGVGNVTIVDRDYVELDNLHRQILFDEDDIKKKLPKAVAAAKKLRKINSQVQIRPVVENITASNISKIINKFDLVMDGTDNFETRFLLNDFCVKNGINWIYGGVVEAYGNSFTIIPGQTPCLQCFIKELPSSKDIPRCDTVGILGTAVNTIASIEVTEAIKLLTDNRQALLGKLISVDVWNGNWDMFEIKREKNCPSCVLREFDFLHKKDTSS